MTVKSGDMLDSPAGATGGGERIDLHRVAGCLGFQGPGDAHRIGSPGPPFRFAVLRESTDRGDRLACDPVSDHTPDRGRRDLVSVPARQPLRGLFTLAPEIGSGPPFRFAVLRESTDRGDRLACDPVSDHTPDRGRRDLVSVPARQPLRGFQRDRVARGPWTARAASVGVRPSRMA